MFTLKNFARKELIAMHGAEHHVTCPIEILYTKT